MSKWRHAEIIAVKGNLIRVHYIGWDPEWDVDINVESDGDRIKPAGTMTALQATGSHTQTSFDGAVANSTASRKQRRISFDPAVLDSYGKNKFPGSELSSPNQSQPSSRMNSFKQPGALTAAVSLTMNGDDPRISHLRGLRSNNDRDDNDSGAIEPPGQVAKPTDILKAAAPRKYLHQRTQSFPASESTSTLTEKSFFENMANRGLHVIEVLGDGNCLFRAVAHQIWLNEERHEDLRLLTVRHMLRHRRRYEMFCDTNFDDYLKAMCIPGTWADDIEIRALEEITDRLICIYDSEQKEIKPINKNFDEEQMLSRNVKHITLSYHGKNHYNSVFDERIPLPLPLRNSQTILSLRCK
jgi:hypothetical protein